MAMDPYALCPCGSGKKVKFCCLDILPEMERVERLQENNQPRMALQILEKLEKSRPDNPWLVTRHAMSLIYDGRADEARTRLGNFLRAHGDDPFANALFGMASLEAEGLPKAKKAIHRAFLRGAAHPEVIGVLGGSLATYHLDENHFLAARQHLALTLRLGNEEIRRRIFAALLDFDGDRQLPYLVRGATSPAEYAGTPETHDQVRKAQRLSLSGCWEEAADLLTQIAPQDEASPDLWHLIGLYRAWDGNHEAAAEALHRAAALDSRFDSAVECETLAQLLDRDHAADAVKTMGAVYDVPSVGRVLTALDQHERFVRMGQAEDDDEDMAGRYIVIDRPMPASVTADITRDALPLMIGWLSIFDRSRDGDGANDEDGPQIFLTAAEGDPLNESQRLLVEAAGGFISPIRDANGEIFPPNVISQTAREDVPLSWAATFPPGFPGARRRQLEAEQWHEIVHNVWPNTPRAALGNKSPREAAADPQLRIPLEAAIACFDAVCDIRGYMLPEAELRGVLGIDTPPRVEPAEGTNLSPLSLWRLRRLKLESLSDDDFKAHILQRALLIRHHGFLYETLQEYLRRNLPDDERLDRMKVYSAIADCCRHSFRDDEALAWIERGREAAEHGADPFVGVLQWKMRELSFRIGDPAESLVPLLLDLWNNYGRKLPELRAHLTEMVAAVGIDPPWQTAIITPESGGASQDVWTPDAPAAPPGEEKKLWLPG